MNSVEALPRTGMHGLPLPAPPAPCAAHSGRAVLHSFTQTHPEIAADIEENPEKRRLLGVLTRALGEQLHVVRAGIRLHAVKCSKDMMPLHKHLSGTLPLVLAQVVLPHATRRQAASWPCPASSPAWASSSASQRRTRRGDVRASM